MIRPDSWLEHLGRHHDIATFTSGHDDLDSWLRRYGLAAQDMDSARTFVLVGEAGVVGYFSLTMGSVRRADAPARLVRAMPAYPVGMVLLGRLAVDRLHQGQGHGALLLAEALGKAVGADEAAAARLVVVDAIDDQAAAFYAHHGCPAVPDHPMRLYRRLKDICASLPAPGSAPRVRITTSVEGRGQPLAATHPASAGTASAVRTLAQPRPLRHSGIVNEEPKSGSGEPAPRPCRRCSGTGVDPDYSRRYTTGGHDERICRDCNGTGERFADVNVLPA